MIIYIKNMVCVRCKMAVQTVLDALQIEYLSIRLGKVKLTAPPSAQQLQKLSEGLLYYHLELMDNKKKFLPNKLRL